MVAIALAATVVKKKAEQQGQRQAHRQHRPRDMQLSEEDSHGDRAHHHAQKYCHDGNVAVGALGMRGLAMAKGVQSDAERAHHHAQRLENADQSGGGNGAHANEAHVVAIDFRGRHVRDGDGGRIDGHVAHVGADEPDHRDQHEVHQHAAGAEDHGDAQAHDVAEAENEADGVEVEYHAMAVDQRLHHRHELEIQVLLPDMKGGDEEIVNRRDASSPGSTAWPASHPSHR